MAEERQDSAGGARPDEEAELNQRPFASLYAELDSRLSEVVDLK